MAKASGLFVGGKKVYQDIDLEELLGVDLSDSPFLVQAMGQELIDHIRNRTDSGKDRNGESFAAYSKAYKQSEDFEAFGKTSKVDMQLRGYMLASLDFDASGGAVRLEFDDRDEELKAYGHMTGMEGHKHLDGKTPAREFFGVNDEEAKELLSRKFKEELDAIQAGQEDEVEVPNLPGQEAAGTMTLEELFGGSLFDEEF